MPKSNLDGTTATTFQVSLGGPKVKANATVLEGRNAADTAYAVVRGGVDLTAPTTDDLLMGAHMSTLLAMSRGIVLP